MVNLSINSKLIQYEEAEMNPAKEEEEEEEDSPLANASTSDGAAATVGGGEGEEAGEGGGEEAAEGGVDNAQEQRVSNLNWTKTNPALEGNYEKDMDEFREVYRHYHTSYIQICAYSS